MNQRESLKSAVVAAYREELRQRYSVQNVRRFDNLSGLREETVDELREFFLQYIYPPYDSRGMRDNSFDEMGNVLKSPRKLAPLFGTALSSIWKLGGRIGAAIQAGFRTLEAYIESKALEKTMLDVASRRGLNPEDFQSHQTVAEVVREIPEKKVKRFQKDMVLLFESLANVKLLESSLEIMQDSRKIMAERPGTYTPNELAGLDFGLELLRAGYHLFRALSQAEVRLVLDGIAAIEADWYSAVFENQA